MEPGSKPAAADEEDTGLAQCITSDQIKFATSAMSDHSLLESEDFRTEVGPTLLIASIDWPVFRKEVLAGNNPLAKFIPADAKDEMEATK